MLGLLAAAPCAPAAAAAAAAQLQHSCNPSLGALTSTARTTRGTPRCSRWRLEKAAGRAAARPGPGRARESWGATMSAAGCWIVCKEEQGVGGRAGGRL